MSRRYMMTLTTTFILVGGVVAVFILLLRHEPNVFKRGVVAPGPLRTQRSYECINEFTQLFNAIKAGQEHDWDIRLTEQQFNSYFAEGFKQSRLDKLILPDDISEPRVAFEPGKIRLAFRYGKGLWSTVVSIDLGVWLTDETNVVAVEIQRIRVGSLPIAAHSILDKLAEMCVNNDIQVKWYRYRGNPVVLLRFGSQKREATVQLRTLHVDRGGMVISGRPLVDPAARPATVALDDPPSQ